MIYSHEKKIVLDALKIYCDSNFYPVDKEKQTIAQKILKRLKEEHDPIGGFCFGDYQSFANDERGYDLTDEQVNDWMEQSRRWFDAGIGMSWDVMGIHLDEWINDNNIEKPIDKAEEG